MKKTLLVLALSGLFSMMAQSSMATPSDNSSSSAHAPGGGSVSEEGSSEHTSPVGNPPGVLPEPETTHNGEDEDEAGRLPPGAGPKPEPEPELPPFLLPLGTPSVTAENLPATVAFNAHVAGQYQRHALLNNSLVFAETVFDQAQGKDGLWGKVNYSSVKNDLIKLGEPTVSLGYNYAVNNELKLGVSGFFGQQSFKTIHQVQEYFESKNRVFGLAFQCPLSTLAMVW